MSKGPRAGSRRGESVEAVSFVWACGSFPMIRSAEPGVLS
jgi:hypothetical protein